MGNHAAGRQAVAVAEAIIARRTTETALEILDAACGFLRDYCGPGRGCDAEFDDAAWPGEVFGDLLTEAFAPGREYEDGEGAWEDDVREPFRKRYNLW